MLARLKAELRAFVAPLRPVPVTVFLLVLFALWGIQVAALSQLVWLPTADPMGALRRVREVTREMIAKAGQKSLLDSDQSRIEIHAARVSVSRGVNLQWQQAAVGGDRYRLDGIHLDRDLEGHGRSP